MPFVDLCMWSMKSGRKELEKSIFATVNCHVRVDDVIANDDSIYSFNTQGRSRYVNRGHSMSE